MSIGKEAKYDDYVRKYLENGYYVAQDADGTIMAYNGPAGINKKHWLGPPAFVLSECPKFKGNWKDSYRERLKKVDRT